jgi:5-methylcytosine-specific restriction protein B
MSQQEPVIQNGQRMYRAGSIGAQLFALADEKKPQTQKEAIAFAVAAGFNEKSAAKNFYEWRRFNGLEKSTTYTVFVTNDAEYLEWLKAHPQGFVLNSSNPPRSTYLVLHRAQCPTIQDMIGKAYIKICAERIEGLWEWLNEKGFENFTSEEHFCNNQNNDKSEISEKPNMTNPIPLNQILFGPPGTGKTYNTINEALRILEPALLANPTTKRTDLLAAFNRYTEAGQIVFCTFHQSFSYEDFVEGLRASTENGAINYSVEPGVFKDLCDRAVQGTTVAENPFADALSKLQEKCENTDRRLVLKTKRGMEFEIEFDGGSTFKVFPKSTQNENPKYCANINLVRKLYVTGDKSKIYDSSYVEGLLNFLKKECGLPELSPIEAKESNQRKYVLIIDEINRGNISKIFGELITLIEPSKRAGQDEALTVTLPYSKEPFSVPDNVYLIGTMNTADRSLASLDIALRRRFDFVSMPPKAALLKDVSVEGVNVGDLLQTMNQRIEVLLGGEHCLGHAYFMALEENDSLALLADIFRRQIIPLLQEYFFEDWQRISWVLNDHRKALENRFLTQTENNLAKLFGDEEGARLKDSCWKVQGSAFDRIEAYAGVIDHDKKSITKQISTQLSTEIRREIEFNGFKISQLKDGGSIRIAGVADGAVKDTLRNQAVILGIDTLNGNGNECTTQELGAKIIKAFDAQNTGLKDTQE